MAWPTPMYVGGARHDEKVLRLLPYMSFLEQQGVLGPLDCLFRELEIPGPGARLGPGVTNIWTRGAGSVRQSYANSLETDDVINLAGTDASGPRSDLVIVRVEDPNIPGANNGLGWDPTDPVLGPFQFTRIIPDVDPMTTDVVQVRPLDSAITIGRIDWPTETGTYEDYMFTDLRSSIDNQRLIVINNPAPPVASSFYSESTHCNGGDDLPAESTAWSRFPNQVAWPIPIPSYATGVDVMIQGNPAMFGGDVYGELRLVIDGNTNVIPTEFDQNYATEEAGNLPERCNVTIGGTYPIPQGSRGKLVEAHIEGRMLRPDLTNGRLVATRGTYFTAMMNFKRTPSFT